MGKTTKKKIFLFLLMQGVKGKVNCRVSCSLVNFAVQGNADQFVCSSDVGVGEG